MRVLADPYRGLVLGSRGKTLLVDAPRPFVWRLQVFTRLFLCALSIVFGANRQVILADRPLPLARNIEDLAQVDVAPDFGPLRVEVAR